MPLGDVGDPPQPENNVASVAPDATWQAPAQNRRRETFVSVSDIVVTLVRVANAESARPGPARKVEAFSDQRPLVGSRGSQTRAKMGDFVSERAAHFRTVSRMGDAISFRVRVVDLVR